MKAFQKLLSDINKLEQQLASDIAKVAAELEPLPGARDMTKLETVWGQATISRRKLAVSLKDGMRQISPANTAGDVKLRHKRAALNTARKDLEIAKSRLRLWERIESIVRAQLSLKPRELYPLKETQVMDEVVDLFVQSMHRISNPTADTQGADANSHGCHPDIPLPMSWFSKLISAAHRICLALQRQRPLRFLDVGSGGGTKVLAATTCFDFCDGLEYEECSVSSGRRVLELLEPERCKLIHGDALEFSDYGEYDVIYYYWPFRSSKNAIQMEERIFAQAKPGTVLLAPLGGLFSTDLHSKGVHELTTHVYITGMSEDEASEIVKTAEQIGQMVPGFGRPLFNKPGYWKPLIEVSARNGYYL
jgi:hypothetical protein